jgi:hypothetical protein
MEKKKASLTAQALGFLLGGIIVGFGFTLGTYCFNLLVS